MKMLRHIKKLAALSVIAMAVGLAVPASAGVLETGTGAMPGWFGETTITDGGMYFSAGVEFAVYMPGVFDTVFGSGADPSGGTEVVYAYQFFNYTPASGAPLVKVTVGLDANEPFTGSPLANVGFLAGTGTFSPSPTSGALAADLFSVRWDFLSPNMITVGQSSDILIYTCPTLPEWGNVAAQNAYGLQQTVLGSVPNPSLSYVPEPGTLALLAIGGLAALRRRRSVR
jgi:hypothetical protein